ncbi:MAG: serine hydrolase, partial [Myxococcota bacterium]
LPNVAPERVESFSTRTAPRFSARTRSRREWELISFAEGLPARVAFYGEKIYGIGESVEHQSEHPFSVAGLDRVALLLEASLRHLQGELADDELMAVGSPRRAIGRWGGDIPDNHAIPVGAAITRMIRDDDATAFDLLGWRLGWRSIQQHLPSFGLQHHSLISPMRAQALAMTGSLAGPLKELVLSDRLQLWRGLDEEERRQIIGQIHNANLETAHDVLTEAYLEATAHSEVDWNTRSRWALALGPRGTAREYGQLIVRLSRGEVLSPAHSGWVLERLKPCSGDHLSGLLPGVSMYAGKLGQNLGVLNAAGILGQIDGGEVAVCLLARDITTSDYTDLVEQTRILASYIYQYILDM